MADHLVRVLNGHQIGQRQNDGYVNATQLCKAAGKKWADYWRLDGTTEFVQALAESTGKPVDSLVEARSGRGGGTWVYPDLAINLAQWLSPRFAVQVSQWVRELLTNRRVELIPTTGDMLRDHIELTHRMSGALVEMYHRQQATEQRVEAVEVATVDAKATAQTALSVAIDAKATAVAATRSVEVGQLFSTVLQFAHRHGREMSKGEAAIHGRRLTQLCEARGFSIRPVIDEDGVQVNSYPDGVLADYFDQVWGASFR